MSSEIETDLKAKAELLELSADTISVYDFNGTPVYLNSAYCRAHGYSLEEMMQMNIRQVSEQEFSRVLESFNRLRDNGELVFEEGHRRKDGSIFILELHSRFFKWGTRELILSIGREITERKKNDELLENITLNSPVGMYISQGGKLVFVNQRFADDTGYTREELLSGKSVLLVPPEEQGRVRDETVAMLKGKRTEPIEFTGVHHNGSRQWILSSVSSIQYRGKPAVIGTAINITHYKKTEEELATSRDQLLELANLLPQGVWLTDLQGNFLFSNRKAIEMFGHKWGDNIGPKDLFPPEDFQKIQEHTSLLISGQETRNGIKLTALKKDGTRFPVMVYDRLIKRDGVPALIQGITVDFTDEQKIQDVLAREQNKLETIISASPVGILVFDSAERVISANPAAGRLFNREIKEVAGLKCGDFIQCVNCKKEELGGCGFSDVCPDCPLFRAIRGALGNGNVSSNLEGETLLDTRSSSKGIWVHYHVKPLELNGEKCAVMSLDDISNIKLMEKALIESEERFRRLAENAQDLIYRYRLVPEPGFEYVSPSALAITGYTPEEHYADSLLIYKLVVPEDWHILEDIVKSPGSYYGKSVILRWVRKDGKIIWTEQRNVPVLDESGKVIALEGIVRDITERKNAEQELITSAANFRNSLAMLPSGIKIVNREGKTIFVNQALLDIYGYKDLDEFLSIPRKQRYTPQSYQDYLKREELRARGESVSNNYEMAIIRKDGTIRNLHRSRAEIMWDGEPSYEIIYEDITERKRAEAALVESNRRFLEAASLLPQSVWELDAQGNFIFWNEAGRKMHGYREDEKVNVLELFAPENRQYVINNAVFLARGQAVAWFESVGLRKDGTRFPVLIHNVPIFRDGKYAGVRGITIDITERKKAEEQERELVVLKELDKLRSELLANVSHELRTPLVAIKGFTATLLRQDANWNEAEKEDFLRTIEKEANRLTNLINDLLDMSRLDARAFNLKTAGVLPKEIIDSVKPEILSLARRHRLHVDIADDLPPVVADITRIGQVITNLVDNAVKFSAPGTLISINAEKKGDAVAFHVEDHGIGLKPESLPRVFYRFYQAESSTESGRVGTGLGLAICKGIIENHDGQIWVESQFGKGSVFSFTLPVAKQ